MNITRYNGTRFISEEEIDQEFTGLWVLVNLAGLESSWDGGYLVATASCNEQTYSELSSIAINEFDANAKIFYGCKERGGNLHVELLG
jgi:hypothetical protein